MSDRKKQLQAQFARQFQALLAAGQVEVRQLPEGVQIRTGRRSATIRQQPQASGSRGIQAR
jgi:hypothetical protein